MCLKLSPAAGGCLPHCTENSHCPALGVCNRWWGWCGPESQGEPNGAGCAGDGVCRGILCLKESDSGAPGGLCASLCSPQRTACPGPGEACVVLLSPLAGGLPLCLPLYDELTGCRPGWTELAAWDLERQQAVAVCQPACKAETCSAEKPCDPWSGLCGAEADDREELGQPCSGHQDCKGLCLDFWPGGYCSAPCSLADVVCPGGGSCTDLGLLQVCLKSCLNDSDCRQNEGYRCSPLQMCQPL